jgi:hypothetical protein
MAENHILLETIALTQTAASVTFDNIPQTGYTDLKVVMSPRDTYSGVSAAIFLVINGTTTLQSSRYLQGSGTSVVTSSLSLGLVGLNTGSTATANTFSNIELYISNYTSSNYKSYSVNSVTENASAEAYANLVAGLWSSNSAITSLGFTGGTLFGAGSTFSLYGVANVNTSPTIAPKASGGNIVANDGTYWYHAFLSSGTFTPYTALTCDYLVVGGGGAGAPSRGGGGGAGGLRSTVGTTGGSGSLESPITFTASSHPVLVGAGGVATAGAFVFVGSNSSLYSAGNTTITSLGGGGGGNTGAGASVLGAPQIGGSGGGGHFSSKPGGAGTAGQGFKGGDGHATFIAGGGGGGAGAVGGNASSSNQNGGAGGIGRLQTVFSAATGTGVSSYFAGGGGGGYYSDGGTTGGAGGTGGGGAGSTGGVGTAGTANTGGGGGAGKGNPGGVGDTIGASGGSGIVIIRYPISS